MNEPRPCRSWKHRCLNRDEDSSSKWSILYVDWDTSWIIPLVLKDGPLIRNLPLDKGTACQRKKKYYCSDLWMKMCSSLLASSGYTGQSDKPPLPQLLGAAIVTKSCYLPPSVGSQEYYYVIQDTGLDEPSLVQHSRAFLMTSGNWHRSSILLHHLLWLPVCPLKASVV